MKIRVFDVMLFCGVYLNTALLGIFNKPNLEINAIHQESAVSDMGSDADEDVIGELPFDESDVHFTVKPFLVDLVNWAADGKYINDFHGRDIAFTVRNDNDLPTGTTDAVRDYFIGKCQEQYDNVRDALGVLCEKITNITTKNKDFIDEDLEEIIEILHGMRDFIDEWQDFEDGCRIVNIAALLLFKASSGQSLLAIILEKGPNREGLWNAFTELLDQIRESASNNENMDAVHLLEKIFTASVGGNPVWFFFHTHADCEKVLSGFIDSLKLLLCNLRGWLPCPGGKFSQVLACWERMRTLKVSDVQGKVVYFCYRPDLVCLDQNIRPGLQHYSDWLVNAGGRGRDWSIADYPNIEAWKQDEEASSYRYKGEDKFNGKEFFHYMWWCGRLREVYQSYEKIMTMGEDDNVSLVSVDFLNRLSGCVRRGFISASALRHFLLDKTNSGESVWSRISKNADVGANNAICGLFRAIIEANNTDVGLDTVNKGLCRQLLVQLLIPKIGDILYNNDPEAFMDVSNIVNKTEKQINSVFVSQGSAQNREMCDKQFSQEIIWTEEDLCAFDD